MALFIKILSVVLEYGMLLCLLFFAVRSANYLFRDIRKKSKDLRTREMQLNEKTVR